MIIPGGEAFKTTLGNKQRNYPGKSDLRTLGQMILPAFAPGFSIPEGASVFTIGSCFARNVEKALLARGITVPTAHFAAPHDEAPGQPNRVLNQYNPATMLHCVQTAGQAPDDRALYPNPGGPGVIDPLLATGTRPVTRARALERRGEINALYGDGLAASEFVVITLGLIETWFDHETGLTLNEAPQHRAIKADPHRWEFRRLTTRDVREEVLNLVEALDAGRRSIVMTVSPVPLQVTFAGGDAVTANAYSKAVLRVVAEEVAQSVPGVDYFPSYEAVTSAGLQAYGEDQVHVRPAVVDRVIGAMTEAYVDPDEVHMAQTG
ncbi:MAG: GSCFA domain-containing protein [Pseudomonadota bacterium]